MTNTPIQNFIEQLCESGYLEIDFFVPNMIKNALEEEKQAIMAAYDAGNRVGFDEHRLSAIDDSDEQYYNTIYNTEE